MYTHDVPSQHNPKLVLFVGETFGFNFKIDIKKTTKFQTRKRITKLMI